MKRLLFFLLILLAACAPAATETPTPTDPPPTEVPTKIPPTAVPPTAIPTPEPPMPIPTPEATPFAVNLETVIEDLIVQFTTPNSMTCDLYVLNDYPNILSTDPATCLPSSPINNILWGKLTDDQAKIIPLKRHEDVLDFLDDFLQADVYASNDLGFGIDPQDTVGQQYALFELNLNGNTYTVILWLNALDAQKEITGSTESPDNQTNNVETPATPPPPGGED
ncbi:MAG: hypothetical protein ABI621_03255 [Chloroflexota bacterium]